MNKRYVITNKKRFFTFFTFLLLLLLTLMALLVSSQVSHSQKPLYFNEYRVGEGDTLWEISKHYLEEDIDLRQFIYEIKKLNDMKTSAIYEGDIIKIPIND